MNNDPFMKRAPWSSGHRSGLWSEKSAVRISAKSVFINFFIFSEKISQWINNSSFNFHVSFLMMPGFDTSRSRCIKSSLRIILETRLKGSRRDSNRGSYDSQPPALPSELPCFGYLLYLLCVNFIG